MKFNPLVRRTAWSGTLVLLVSGLIVTLVTAYQGYGSTGAIFGLLVIMIMMLPLVIMLIPSNEVQTKEKIVYLYADERAPEEFDTQA